jgi:Fe-S cluster biogenesis protein NfuA
MFTGALRHLLPPRPSKVLGEIRPYLVGTGGGGLELQGIDGPIVKVKITGPAANVMTVRVAVTQKLREKIPGIAAVRRCGCGPAARPGGTRRRVPQGPGLWQWHWRPSVCWH